MISAETVRPSVDFNSPPSPASSTSLSVMVSPASPASFSTTILSPAATRYCLPPVRTIANMAFPITFESLTVRPQVRAERGLLHRSGRPVNQGATILLPVRSVAPFGPQPVATVGEPLEHAGYGGMTDRLAERVGQQILLADIGDVPRFRILGEQVVERLVLRRPDVLGDRLVPFLAVGEDRVDVEDHAAKVEQPVTHDLADREAGMGHGRRRGGSGRFDLVAGLCHRSHM